MNIMRIFFEKYNVNRLLFIIEVDFFFFFTDIYSMTLKILYYFFFSFIIYTPFSYANDHVPDIIGTWVGKNDTVSEQRGFRSWEKKVEILEQNGRRFKGTFSYTDGTKNFFGVIHPDNQTITWVASNSRGYNLGKILSKNRISACYVESGIDATAGCADLTRK